MKSPISLAIAFLLSLAAFAAPPAAPPANAQLALPYMDSALSADRRAHGRRRQRGHRHDHASGRL